MRIHAAETGHLVFGTLHTQTSYRTIVRILDQFPPEKRSNVRTILAGTLRGIVSQLLLPAKDGKSMELAYEILVNTPAIGHLIREERVHQIRGMMQAGKRQGMVLLDESLARLAKEGRIDRETAIAHSEDKKFLEKELAS